MSRICELCEKGPQAGRHIVRRGLRKSKGGIGLHTTGISKRNFLPNLQKVRVVEKGCVRSRRICTACLRSGKVTKA